MNETLCQMADFFKTSDVEDIGFLVYHLKCSLFSSNTRLQVLVASVILTTKVLQSSAPTKLYETFCVIVCHVIFVLNFKNGSI